MFKCKLYKKFYPVETERQIENLVNENYKLILQYLFKNERYEKMRLMQIEDKYKKQLKKEVSSKEVQLIQKYREHTSFLGNIKHENVRYNKYVYETMAQELCKQYDTLEKNAKLLDKIIIGEKVSIEEINCILESMNCMYHKNVCFTLFYGILCILLIISLLFYFYYISI